MDFWNDFYKSTAKRETAQVRHTEKDKIRRKDNVDKIDMYKLARYLFTWLVGGVVSLFPVFMEILTGTTNQQEKMQMNLLMEFFADKDVFLVAATLTISVLFEIIFDQRVSLIKYGVISIGIILIVTCIHVFTLIQNGKSYEYFYLWGMCMCSLCILNNVVGYIFASYAGRKKDNGTV